MKAPRNVDCAVKSVCWALTIGIVLALPSLAALQAGWAPGALPCLSSQLVSLALGQESDDAAQEEPVAKEEHEPPEQEKADEAAQEEPAEKSAAPAPKKAAEKAAEKAAVPKASSRPARKMSPEELIRLMGLDRESKQKEAEELVKLALSEKSRLELRSAEGRLEQALKLDPGNEEARRHLADVRTLLGDKRGEIPQVEKQISDELKVAMKQAQAEVRNAINSGARHSERKEFDRAISDFEKAIQLVRSFPFNLQLDEELRDAQGRLKKAQEDRKIKAEEERIALEARMKETRDSEIRNSIDLLKNRVQELRRKAQDAWERQDYAQVEVITAQILLDLPDDLEARQRHREAVEERHLQTQHKIVLNQVENNERVLLGLEESAISYQKIFRYPSAREWQRLQPKVITIEERAAAEESAAERDIKRKLEEPRTIAFTEKTPFLDALKTLSTITDVNFILTREAQTAVRDENLEVSLPQVRETPVRSILNLLLGQTGEKNFQYTIRNGAVVIGPRDDLKDSLKLYIVFYDVADVTQPRPDYPAPDLALDELAGQATSGGAISVGGGDEEVASPGVEHDKLVELISKELKDETGETVGAEPKFQGGKLMVKTTLENHQKIQRLLSQLRKNTGHMVTVESRFLTIQDNFLEEIGVDLGNPSNTFLPNSIPDIDGAGTSVDPGYEFTNVEQDYNARIASIGTLSNPLGSRVSPFNISSEGGGAYQWNYFAAEKYQIEAILTGVGKEQSKKRLSSPRVTAFNTQISHTLVINQAAYIQDLEVNQTGVIPVINPVIGILNSGSILEVRPTVSYDRKYVVLEIQPTLAEKLQSEVAVLNLSGSFTVVPVELPVLNVIKIKTTVTIPDGGTVLVGGLKREITDDVSLGIPILRRIPILNLLFGRIGTSSLRSSLFVLINAKITIVQEEEERLFNA